MLAGLRYITITILDISPLVHLHNVKQFICMTSQVKVNVPDTFLRLHAHDVHLTK